MLDKRLGVPSRKRVVHCVLPIRVGYSVLRTTVVQCVRPVLLLANACVEAGFVAPLWRPKGGIDSSDA